MSQYLYKPLSCSALALSTITAVSLMAVPASHATTAPAALAGAVTTTSATTTQTNEWWPIFGENLYLEGAGYGHGRGMSQWGAEGAARQGKTVNEILSFYYPNTKIQAPSSTWDRPIRVRLDGWGSFGETVTFSGHSGELKLTTSTGTTLLTVPAATPITLTLHDDGTTKATTLDSTQPAVTVPAGSILKPTTGHTAVGFASGKKATFRGTFSTYVSKGTLIPVNTLDMDEYLKSVVPSEVYTSWNPTTLQAQSIAARSYASSWMRRQANDPDYDVCSTTRCQMYLGIAKENDKTSAAVTATSRKILTTYGVPIVAEFSSANGGWRNKAGVNYYGSGEDPFDAIAPRHRWTKKADASKLATKWPELGKATAIQVTERSEGGPMGGLVSKATIHGTKGTVNITGNQLRWTLGLYSTRTKANLSGILATWLASGGATGPLGAVASAEHTAGPFQKQKFANGELVWSLESGAVAVSGKIAAKAKELGWEYTGAPLAAASTQGGNTQQHFELGTITQHRDGSVSWTHGLIHDKWQELGPTIVGQPVASQRATSAGYSQDFTHGTLTWNISANTVDWEPSS